MKLQELKQIDLRQFANVLYAYNKSSEELRKVINEMAEIIVNSNDEDDKQAAEGVILDALVDLKG
jgi:hypothetical protein